MNKKKIVKKKEPIKKDLPKKRVADRGFVGALALFVGFSTYAVTSFVSGNNDFLNTVYTDVTGAIPEIQNPFIDLPSDHENAVAVVSLYERGIVSGYFDGTFKPDFDVNRAEFAKMLAEAVDLDYAAFDSSNLEFCFTDVTALPDHWFAPAVCAAKVEGWINGYQDGRYSPAQKINKAEALKIVLEAFDFAVPSADQITSVPFNDVSTADWFAAVATVGASEKIVSGSGAFDGGTIVTRGDTAQMIYNAMRSKGLL